jgi:hypothetical protein
MSQQSKWGKTLRIVAIVLMAAAAVMMLLGGIGTTCVAWGAEKYPPFRGLVPYKWLYQASSIVTIGAAVLGLWATLGLTRGKRWAYGLALLSLVIGLLLSGAQMYVSEVVRGKSAPNNVRVYITVFTLLVLLLLRIPSIWNQIGLLRPGHGGAAGPTGGLAAMVAGALLLSVPMWAGPTHTIDGYNLVYVLQWPLLIGGSALTVFGLVLLALAGLDVPLGRCGLTRSAARL